MAAVRGVGFSSAVQEDIYFDRLRENLDQAEELGVDFVELPFFAMDLIAGGRVLQSQMHRLHDALKARSLGYTAHGPISLNFMQPPEIAARHMTVAKAAIEAAAEIGAPHIVLHGGRMTAGQAEAEIEDLYARQREAFALLGDIAAKHSMIIAVENIHALGSKERASLPSRLAREIEAINHPNVRGCLDFSHAALLCTAEGADFFSEAKALARVSSHLHIHDSFGDPAQFWTFSRSERLAYGLGDLHLPIGWGSIP
jgi:sugar phosphate isomerase/epimerase